MYKIDLNSDLGESFGAYTMGKDGQVLESVSSANVACGFHAGDPSVMVETVKMASSRGVAIGAHPGYPDLVGFGRRNLKCTPDQVYADCLYQIGALSAACRATGTSLQHVKPHGAMYNTAAKDLEMARAIAGAVKDGGDNLILMGLSGSLFQKAAEETGVPFASEAFADRAYMADGTLVPRSMEGAVIHDSDEAASRVVRMIKEGIVTTLSGEDIELRPQSICLHGDTAEAVEMSRELRNTLEAEGIEIANLREVLKL
ncbi:LamB/YcsF family protein [Dethiosulfovibrio peptidovorans DSM 11002]|uniref:5-oxoprolinase subunit A n=1 Tax=Dethiosulfovibrio peptidovorans DSM 11002 TaxID=469381 RepID=D2Z6X6_9BACT|nr:5-oxoprolinase subunit PxpA [Dethiosulfovibrio peptidovorans]EFC91223.1 LamB/YcsF family protein [Dethiosulfovibrio peptidovorans DSM 11002]